MNQPTIFRTSRNMRLIHAYHRITLLLIALMVGTTGFAQTIDAQLKQLEQIKAVYGEMDERYLSSLNEVIGTAANEGYFQIALQKRRQHTELCKKKYGEQSVQYAEGLIRIGNCINLMVDEDAPWPSEESIPYYTKGIKLFEENDEKTNYIYIYALNTTIQYYANNRLYRQALVYSDKWVESRELTCQNNMDSVCQDDLFAEYISRAAWFNVLGVVDDALLNVHKAYELYKKGQYGTFNKYRIGLMYNLLSVLYHEKDDISTSKKYDEEFVDFTKEAFGEISNEYSYRVSILANDYFRLKQYDEAINGQKLFISLVEENLNKQRKIAKADSAYIQALWGLSVYLEEAYNNSNNIQYLEEEYTTNIRLKEIHDKDGWIPSIDYRDIEGRISYYQLITKKYDEYKTRLHETDSINRLTYQGHYLDYLVAFSWKLDNNSPLLSYSDYQDVWNKFRQEHPDISSECIKIEKKTASLRFYDYVHDYDSMLMVIHEIYDLQRKHPECGEQLKDSIIRMANLHMSEGICLIDKRDRLAKDKLELSIRELESINDSNKSVYLHLGNYYYAIEQDYEQAKNAYVIYFNYLRSIGDTLSYNYFSTLNNVGLCWLNLGDMYRAIVLLEKTATEIRAVFGEVHPIYATSLQNMSLYYYHTADYKKALFYGNRAAEILRQLYGEDDNEYANALINLGTFSTAIQDDDVAIQYLSKGIRIIRDNDGDTSPRLLMPYGILIQQLAVRKDWPAIDSIHNLAKVVVSSNNLSNTEAGATYLMSLGQGLLMNGNPKSWHYFGAYCRTMDSLGFKTTDNFFRANAFWVLSGFLQDELPQQNRNVYLLTALYRYQFWGNIIHQNQIEREGILTSREYNLYKDLVFTLNKYDTTKIALYNFILLNKGLLLATSVDYAKTIYESGDSALIKRYEKLQKDIKKNKSTAVFSEETARIQNEERQIILAASRLGASNYVSCDYDSILSVIKDNEVAVEYIVYNDYNRLNEGIIEKRYAALVVRKHFNQPQFIPLCTADTIEPLVTGNPNLMYNGGEISQAILNLLWKPIEKYVYKGDEVYFSPDGCLYKLALENIQVAENVALGTKYNMHRCSSTRQIRDKQTESKYRNAVLYGGLSYDVDEETMRNNSRNYEPSMTRGYTPAFGENETNVRRGWNYLPGTKQEIDDVSAILRKKKIVCDTYSGADGNEESFKAMSGSNISILHIATHGFYIQEGKADKVKLLAQPPQWMQNSSMIDKALRRSGLMLAGGNKAWKAGHGIEGIEDGVLTAQEISNMNLASVDLLVLSACETGLGDVANEGVFGLQWAFKSARVGTIIMSLWDVDDNATALMMKTFYRELTTGKDKREAFALAQKEVKKIYKDPLQWAAFIMLD